MGKRNGSICCHTSSGSQAKNIVAFVPSATGTNSVVTVTTADGPAVLTDRPIRYEFTDTRGWYPFTFPLNAVNLDAIDLTRFLDPPAGKRGFVRVGKDGQFRAALKSHTKSQ